MSLNLCTQISLFSNVIFQLIVGLNVFFFIITDLSVRYFWEYGHRMMGRFLGVAFAGPFLYFAARGKIPRSLYPRLGVLFSLGGLQVDDNT